MLEPMLAYKARNAEDLQRYTDEWMQSLADKYEHFEDLALTSKIDAVLKHRENGWEEIIIRDIVRPELRECVDNDFSLCVFRDVCGIYEKEKAQGIVPTLVQFASLEEMCSFYQMIVFFLRRLEFDRGLKKYRDLFHALGNGQISTEFLLMVLENGRILKKDYVAIRLANLLERMDYGESARRIEAWATDRIKAGWRKS